jgi:RNA polymerase sigma-70 factor, ECF subfamily
VAVTVRSSFAHGPADDPSPHLTAALEAARDGDEAAFRVLYRELQPRMLRYLRGLIGDEAEDVASESWLQICRDLPSFSGDVDGFRRWTITVARHRALDHARHRQRRPVSPVPVEDLAAVAGGPDTANAAVEAASTAAAVDLIATLPRDQAEAVLLRVVVGLDATTVGQILGKRPGAVRTAAHRGLRRLAQLLEDLEDGRR